MSAFQKLQEAIGRFLAEKVYLRDNPDATSEEAKLYVDSAWRDHLDRALDFAFLIEDIDGMRGSGRIDIYRR